MTNSQDLLERIEGQNLATRFLENAARNSDVEVIRWKDADGAWQSWTMAQLSEITARLVTGLAGLGVGKGDTIVLMLKNRPEFHALDLAALFLGATPVSIYNSSAPEQIEYLVNDCKAKVAVVENDAFLERFLKVRSELPTLEHIVLLEDSELVEDAALRYSDLALSAPADLDVHAGTATLDDIATVIYTSGTTGPPKGVMLSHRNVSWTLESMGLTMREQTTIDNFAGKRHVSYLPMAHIFERLLGHYYLLDFATQVACCPETTQLTAYTSEVRPNIFIGVPRGPGEALRRRERRSRCGSREGQGVQRRRCGRTADLREDDALGTATQEEIDTWNFLDAVANSSNRARPLDWTRRRSASPGLLRSRRRSWRGSVRSACRSRRATACRRPRPCSPGRTRRSPVVWAAPVSASNSASPRTARCWDAWANMFVGYLGQPEKTAETLDEDGWVHTGDIGVLDEDGYLKIVYCKKELIITAGGKNVSPANLEAELKMIPLVGQACAIGEQRPFMTALVVLDPDAVGSLGSRTRTDRRRGHHGGTGRESRGHRRDRRRPGRGHVGVQQCRSGQEGQGVGRGVAADSDLLTPTSKLKRRGILAKVRPGDRGSLRQVDPRVQSGEQAVADAADGDDQLRVVGVVLDLHPQATHVGVDEPGVAEVLVAPHPFQQLVAGEHRCRRARRTRTAAGTRSWSGSARCPPFRTMPCSRRSSTSPKRLAGASVAVPRAAAPAAAGPGCGRPVPWGPPAW